MPIRIKQIIIQSSLGSFINSISFPEINVTSESTLKIGSCKTILTKNLSDVKIIESIQTQFLILKVKKKEKIYFSTLFCIYLLTKHIK